MKSFTKSMKGSIALFLSMIILLLVILEGFLIDGSKVLAGKAFLSNAGELSLNAGLTYYDEALRDIYGLFAVSKSEEELTANLKVYFQKTLGEATGEDSDPGYVDSLLDYVEKSVKSGWDEGETGKLLNLKTGTFTAKGVSGSELSNPYVLKNQILEYMKYRGPASLGYGMLEKLYAFKEVDKQQKTLEKKLEVEEKMTDVQEACEDAYGNIKPYNQMLENQLKPEYLETLSKNINQKIQEAISVTFTYSAINQEYDVDPVWKKKDSSSSHDVPRAVDALNPSVSTLEVNLEEVESGLASEDVYAHILAGMSAIKARIGYKENFENAKEIYTRWENYQVYYEEEKERIEEAISNAAEDDDTSDLEEELDALEEEHEDYSEVFQHASDIFTQCIECCEQADAQLKKDIDDRMNMVATNLTRIEDDAEKLQQLSEYGKDALGKVKSCMSQLSEKRENWKSSIDQLSDGDIKTSMTDDYDNKIAELDEGKIDDLIARLDKGKAYAIAIQTSVKNVNVTTYKPYEKGIKNSYAGDVKLAFESIYKTDISGYPALDYQDFNTQREADCANTTQALTNATYTTYLITDASDPKSGDGVQLNLQSYTDEMDSISAKNDPFYKYLERICPNDTHEEDTAAKDDAKEAKKDLFENGSCDLNVSGLPSMESSDSADSDSTDFKNAESGDADESKNKDTADKAIQNTANTANLLSGIGDLLQKGRDKLYLTEYATEMFSYYTADKDPMKNHTDTLSGYAFSSAHNKMYKSEMEYILWGNEDGNVDVKNTLTAIFGIRFLLNSLYAFTGDPEIRSVSLALATSIAGWTGFGVPLVQSVIIIGFALAETSKDMIELKNGESVPIYKSTSTWVVKPSGITKEVVHNAINKTADAAKNKLFEDMDKLTEETKDKFKEELEKYKEDTVDNLVDTASAAVLDPLQSRVLMLVNVLEESETAAQNTINEQVNQCIATVRNAVPDDGSVLSQVKFMAIDYVTNNIESDLKSSISTWQNSSFSSQKISEQVYSKFQSIKVSMRSSLESEASSLVNQASETVNSALDSSNEALQKNVSESMDNMLMRINCGVSFSDIGDNVSGTVDNLGGKSRVSGAAALTMNYREYLWLMIAVKSMQNEDELVKRIGNLIQANLASSDTKPSANFDITQAFTFVEITASADITTTFFAMPVPVTGGGTKIYGNDQYTIGYHGTLGF